MAENGAVDYQELVDEVCALLGTPATLEGRDFRLIAFGAHDSEDDRVMDPVRTRTILRRRSAPAVREWFESFGIATARRPVRIPPEPAAGVLTGRVCLPVRHGPVVYGYLWLLDDGAVTPGDPRLDDAMVVAGRIGALLAEEARAGARLGELLRAALTAATPGAARELAAALGAPAEGPLTGGGGVPGEPGADPPVPPAGELGEGGAGGGPAPIPTRRCRRTRHKRAVMLAACLVGREMGVGGRPRAGRRAAARRRGRGRGRRGAIRGSCPARGGRRWPRRGRRARRAGSRVWPSGGTWARTGC
ncbi:PucR family transcriptional regulator [Streptomyces specialis]|uniref:PucR family transcriptional regulator n=1 Tax=Streptomyces specialis TaxID=498367 RepID=UPI00389A67D1